MITPIVRTPVIVLEHEIPHPMPELSEGEPGLDFYILGILLLLAGMEEQEVAGPYPLLAGKEFRMDVQRGLYLPDSLRR